jgi:Uma2 family endonuclease
MGSLSDRRVRYTSAMQKVRRVTTAEQLLAAGDIGPCELVRGRLVMMTPAGEKHGRFGFNLARILGNHVAEHALGTVYAAETGFILARNPDTVRAPDIAFVRARRRSKTTGRGFIPGPPDLAVEVVSPDNTKREPAEKARDYLEAGTREVWVVDPDDRTVTLYRPGGRIEVLNEGQTLTGGKVVPGFRIPVAAVFAC